MGKSYLDLEASVAKSIIFTGRENSFKFDEGHSIGSSWATRILMDMCMKLGSYFWVDSVYEVIPNKYSLTSLVGDERGKLLARKTF